MPNRMTIDRFEGDRKEIAVLVSEDGEHQVTVPKKMLPRGAKAGDVLTMEIEAGGSSRASGDVAGAPGAAIAKDEDATQAVVEKTKRVQADLKKTDPGGDIEL